MPKTRDVELPVEADWVPGMLKKPRELNWKCAKAGCHLTWNEHLGKKGQLLKRFKDHRPIQFHTNRRSMRARMKGRRGAFAKRIRQDHKQLHWLQRVRLENTIKQLED